MLLWGLTEGLKSKKKIDFFGYRLTDSVNDPVSFKDLQQTLVEIINAQCTILQRGDLTILRKRVSMGMGTSNPVEKVSFFINRGSSKSEDQQSLY